MALLWILSLCTNHPIGGQGIQTDLSTGRIQAKPFCQHKQTCPVFMQVMTDVDGSVMESFTLHKPINWRPRDTDRLEHWEKSVLSMAGTSGHAANATIQAKLMLQHKQVQEDFDEPHQHVGPHHSWVQGIIRYIKRHRSHMLQEFLTPEQTD